MGRTRLVRRSLPATPSYERSGSGVVAELGKQCRRCRRRREVFALTGFDRDGAAAEYVSLNEPERPHPYPSRVASRVSHARQRPRIASITTNARVGPEQASTVGPVPGDTPTRINVGGTTSVGGYSSCSRVTLVPPPMLPVDSKQHPRARLGRVRGSEATVGPVDGGGVDSREQFVRLRHRPRGIGHLDDLWRANASRDRPHPKFCLRTAVRRRHRGLSSSCSSFLHAAADRRGTGPGGLGPLDGGEAVVGHEPQLGHPGGPLPVHAAPGAARPPRRRPGLR
jgi:hypothetical protein